jgi:hypothetical protein
MPETEIKEVVQERYAEIARGVRASGASCCYDGERGSEGISANLYRADENDYRARLATAGIEAIEIEPTRIYDIGDARGFLAGKGIDADAIAGQVEGKFMSAFVRARKRVRAGACCA